MKAREFYSALCNSIKNREDIIVERHKITYKKGKYDFIKILSREIRSEDKVILIRAGIHGDEIAGPLTVLKHANRIINLAHRNDLKIILYPLGNPSGFEAGLRYNIDGDKGSEGVGNNDFLRYELKNGEITDDVGESDDFKKWYWASNKKLQLELPKETRLMLRLLKKDPLSQVAACLDLHQDCITPEAPAGAYHYSFGDLEVYKNIVKKIEEILPVLRNQYVSVGCDAEIKTKTDNRGFIVKHDGALPDLMHRLGTKYCVTCETTGVTPLDVACKVNLIWISGVVSLLGLAEGNDEI